MLSAQGVGFLFSVSPQLGERNMINLETVLPKDLARIVKKGAGKWFSKNSDLFLNNSIDLNDLELEGYMEVSKLLNNGQYCHLSIDHLRKLVKTALNRKMQKLVNKYKKMKEIVIHLPNPTVDSELVMTDEDYLQTKSINPSIINIDAMLFNDLKEICTKDEYELIHKRFLEGKSLKQIAIESNLTEGRVSQMLNKLLGEIRDKIGPELRS